MKPTETSILSPVGIRARLAKKLRNPAFRRRYFRARAQEEVAQQILELRERRHYRQIDLAHAAKMKQSAVSRIEKADYSAWTYKTLLRIAAALDAQLRIVFEANEDVIARYETEPIEEAAETKTSPPSAGATHSRADQRIAAHPQWKRR